MFTDNTLLKIFEGKATEKSEANTLHSMAGQRGSVGSNKRC